MAPRKFRRNPGTPWALAALFILIAGGVLFSGSRRATLGVPVHDAYYVLPMGAVLVFVALAFAVCGLIYYAFAKLFGRRLNSRLAGIHFWCSLFAVAAIVAQSLFSARGGSVAPGSVLPMPVIVADLFAFVASLLFCLAQAIFLFNLVWSSFRGEKL